MHKRLPNQLKSHIIMFKAFTLACVYNLFRSGSFLSKRGKCCSRGMRRFTSLAVKTIVYSHALLCLSQRSGVAKTRVRVTQRVRVRVGVRVRVRLRVRVTVKKAYCH